MSLACLQAITDTQFQAPMLQASGPEPWTEEQAIKAANLVLKSCIVGLFMPPLRQSLLRVTHNVSHTSRAPCVYEHCT